MESMPSGNSSSNLSSLETQLYKQVPSCAFSTCWDVAAGPISDTAARSLETYKDNDSEQCSTVPRK